MLCRAELVAHYAALSHNAEQRRERAEWREARWRLAVRRQEWWEGERERWERVAEKERERERERESERERERTEGKTEEEVLAASHRSTVSQLPSPLSSPLSPPLSSSPRQPPPLSPPPRQPPPAPDSGEATNEPPASSVPATPSQPATPTPLATPSHPATPTHDYLKPIRGHAPPTTIQYLLHPGVGGADSTGSHTPSGSDSVAPPSTDQQSAHTLRKPVAHAPPTTIQNLLYPVTSADETTPTSLWTPATNDSTAWSISCPPPQPYPLSFPQLGGLIVCVCVCACVRVCVCSQLTAATDEAPQSDLLTPVIGPIPVQNGTETDMLLPLPSLLDRSLSLPLLTQYVP